MKTFPVTSLWINSETWCLYSVKWEEMKNADVYVVDAFYNHLRTYGIDKFKSRDKGFKAL